MIALWSNVVVDEILSKIARHPGQRFIYDINPNPEVETADFADLRSRADGLCHLQF